MVKLKSMIIHVAVAGPFLTPLDYRCDSTQTPMVGGRVWVKVRNKKQLGVVVATNVQSNLANEKILMIDEVVDKATDKQTVFSKQELKLLLWAAHYYHEPIGNVLQTAMPAKIRQGGGAVKGIVAWQLTDTGKLALEQIKPNATAQHQLWQFLQAIENPVCAEELNHQLTNWRPAMKRFIQAEWVKEKSLSCLNRTQLIQANKQILNQQQQQVVNSVLAKDGFNAFLLEGVTGSGKTEAYLGIIEKVLQQGKQALVLVPEIGLTPQTVARFEAYLQQSVAVIHSGLSDKERHCAWSVIKSNQVKVLLGTRSAVFTPFANLGVCILDEEHDLSFKQQDNFRYSARDCLVRRANIEGVPVVLGSATPSLESLHNAEQGKYHHLELTQRATGAKMPTIKLLDVRGDQSVNEHAGIANVSHETIQQHLEEGGQVLIFLNRRGYAPVLICHDCGWQADCPQCDSHMTYHHQYRQLKCHHCGSQQNLPSHCPSCGGQQLQHKGLGTEKLAEQMQNWFPNETVLRVDRDTTKNKGQMQKITQQAAKGEAKILVGTQMLAKGHHFPKVSLVVVLDVDQGLFSCDFRAAERMAQLVTQVAGRAGRTKQKKGMVLLQTFNPQNPLLNTLVEEGYHQFAKTALAERKSASLPPFSFQILLRAESIDPHIGWDFLQDIQQALQNKENSLKNHQGGGSSDGYGDVFGPVAAPMLRKEARFRYQLLIQATNRASLHQWFGQIESQIYAHPLVSKLRWSIDVDPQDMG